MNRVFNVLSYTLMAASLALFSVQGLAAKMRSCDNPSQYKNKGQCEHHGCKWCKKSHPKVCISPEAGCIFNLPAAKKPAND